MSLDTQIAALTQSTNEMLNAVNTRKSTFDSSIAAASTQAALAEASAALASTKADDARNSAENAAASAAFKQSGPGTVERSTQSKLAESVSIKDFGAVGDGVTSDNAAVLAAEASAFPYINLVGLTVLTTLDESQITKGYFNGTLYYAEFNGSKQYAKPVSPLQDTEIQRPRTKSPILDWAGKRVLWLGTSIPAQGSEIDSYPTLFGKSLNCTVDNMSWSGSSVTYDYAADPFAIGTVKGLSMTNDDRLWGLATYGSTSAYDDSFDPITKASQMTCDYRVKNKFSLNAYDCVMLDHGHNDRLSVAGELNPTKKTISAITKGATTTITSAGHGLVVGDAVALEVVGISFLNYAAARVQSVSGNDFVLNIDSSAYAGTFTSGAFVRLDRATIFGSWNFLIYYIKNCIVRYGNTACKIILAGAPNEYTAGRAAPNEVYSNATYLKQMATKWDLSFFDIGYFYDIKTHDVLNYFPDGYHPTTTATRQALANHWTTWAQGGASKKSDETDFLPTGVNKSFLEQREAIYSKFIAGFGTPKFISGAETSIFTEDFVSISDWTVAGAGTASLVTSPWDALKSAMLCDAASGGQTAHAYRTATFSTGTAVEFDLMIPVTTGLVTGAPGTVGIMKLDTGASPAGAYVCGVQLIATADGVFPRISLFKDASNAIYSAGSQKLLAGTKYRMRIEFIKSTSTFNGAALMYIDGVLVGKRLDIDSSFFTVAIGNISLGISTNSLAVPFSLYFGDAAVKNIAIHDFTNRYTGSFTSADGKTVMVVNGIIVGAA